MVWRGEERLELNLMVSERSHYFEDATETSAHHQWDLIGIEDVVGVMATTNDVRPTLFAEDQHGYATRLVLLVPDGDNTILDH